MKGGSPLSPATLPTGTVTFLMTDVERSTRLWEESPEATSQAIALHDEIVGSSVRSAGGWVIRTKGEGDSTFSAFAKASDAVGAALNLQRALTLQRWPKDLPIRVRIALHTGEAEMRGGDYFGTAVNRCARVRRITRGAQVLLSETTAGLIRDSLPEGAALRDLGPRRLDDLARPERVFQLSHPDLTSEFPPPRSLDVLPTNLPIQLTSFIGRDREVAALKELLSGTRLLTAVGPGGSGKTRLALQVAAEVVVDYPDGVWLADLSSTSDPELVVSAAGRALAISEQPGVDILGTIENDLRDKELLLILDNCEHLIDSCAAFADTFLRFSDRLKILATSREALRVPGEVRFLVPPLSLATEADDSPTDSDAVRLFVERARALRPDRSFHAEDFLLIGEICRRVDGLPLAVELAAAATESMSLNEIVAAIEDRFRLLVRAPRTASVRHRTLREAIGWSYDLLDEEERTVFRRLSVFAGGFSPDAAASVATDSSVDKSTVTQVVSNLLGKSLLTRSGNDEDKVRLTMLETIRVYARELLRDAKEEEDLRRIHAEHFVSWAEEISEKLDGPQQGLMLERLEQEHDNLRAALDWSIGRDPEIGLRLATALGEFWVLRDYLTEGLGRLLTALSENTSPTALRAMALFCAGRLAWRQGDYSSAKSFADAHLAAAEELGQETLIADALGNTSFLWVSMGEVERGRTLAERQLVIAERLGDHRRVMGARYYLGMALTWLGDVESARPHLTEVVEAARRSGSRYALTASLFQLANCAIQTGDLAEARRLLEETIPLRLELGDKGGLSFSLNALARVSARAGDPLRALRLASSAAALREATGVEAPSLAFALGVEDFVSIARRALGRKASDQAWREGASLSVDEAVRYALGTEDLKPKIASRSPLTRREEEIAMFVAEGMTNREIADRLVLSARTVDAHVEHIRTKLGVHSRVQIGAWVFARRSV